MQGIEWSNSELKYCSMNYLLIPRGRETWLALYTRHMWMVFNLNKQRLVLTGGGEFISDVAVCHTHRPLPECPPSPSLATTTHHHDHQGKKQMKKELTQSLVLTIVIIIITISLSWWVIVSSFWSCKNIAEHHNDFDCWWCLSSLKDQILNCLIVLSWRSYSLRHRCLRPWRRIAMPWWLRPWPEWAAVIHLNFLLDSLDPKIDIMTSALSPSASHWAWHSAPY